MAFGGGAGEGSELVSLFGARRGQKSAIFQPPATTPELDFGTPSGPGESGRYHGHRTGDSDGLHVSPDLSGM
jgi:hypothetical protein